MMNPDVDFYFDKARKWKEEVKQLRMIILDCGLVEELKWGVPCYTYDKSNVVLIHTFREYCALLFHKGVLLRDPEDILIQQTKNVQSARQLRFANVREIIEREEVIRAYIREAVEVEKAGLKVELKKTKEYEVPEEFQTKLDEWPELRRAFESLTPGRQRGYILHFAAAKRSATRTARVEKNIERILDGKGLND